MPTQKSCPIPQTSRLHSNSKLLHSINVSRETHFWYVLPSEVKSESLLDQYLELLSPCEKQNILSLREGELRKGALLARVLVRTTIARCMTPLFSLHFLVNYTLNCERNATETY